MKSSETVQKKGGQAMQGHLFKTGHSFFADQFIRPVWKETSSEAKISHK